MSKTNIEELFGILSEVSNESVSSNRELFEKMSDYQLVIDEKMYDLMKEIHYEKKFAIIDELKQVGRNINILLHFPQMMGKNIVGMDMLPPAKSKEIYKLLLSEDFQNDIPEETVVDKLMGTVGKTTISNLFPTIVSSDSSEISVLNVAENDVKLSNKQYVDLLTASVNEQLDLSSLIHAVVIPGQLKEKTGVIIFPEKNDEEKKFNQSLMEAVDTLVIQGKNCDISRLKQYKNVKQVYIAGRVSEEKKKELALYFNKCHIDVKYGRSLISLTKEAISLEHEVNNYCFISIIKNALFEISWYLATKNDELKQPMAMVNDDIVFKNKETKKTLKEIQEKYRNEIDRNEKVYLEYKECMDLLLGDISYIQEKLGIYEDKVLDDGKLCINQHVDLYRILIELIVKMIDTYQTFPEQNYKDVVRKKISILSSLTGNQNLEEILTNLLMNQECQGGSVELFLQNISDSQVVNRFIIRRSEQVNLDDMKLVSIAAKIDGKLTAKEKLILGKNELSNESTELAKEYLFEAAFEGNEEAGQILLNDFDLSIDEIKQIADQGNVAAAYLLGKKIIKNEPVIQGRFNEDDALKYLHIAASKESLDAVKLLGEIWYEKIGEGETEEDDEESAECAYYYYQLAEKMGLTNSATMEKIGYLAYYLDKYKKAMTYLKKADTMDAHYYLGIMYEAGDGCSADEDKALEYYEQAMNEGHSDAAVEYERLNAEIEAKLRKNTINDNTSYSSYTYYSSYYSSGYYSGYSSGW